MNIFCDTSVLLAAAKSSAGASRAFDSSSKAMSRKMRSLRKSSMGAKLNIQEEHDLKASLSDIGREEERRDKDQS